MPNARPRRAATRTRSRARETFDDLDDALELLHFAFRSIVEEPDRLLAARGLGRMHHRILYFIRRNPGLSVGELLEVLDITKQALHRPMKDLVAQGLIGAARTSESRRTKALTLTRAGAAFEVKLSASQRAAFSRAFALVDRANVHAWKRIMFALGEGRARGALARSL
jgi:DNA-binding MarR family transcriptional regulator